MGSAGDRRRAGQAVDSGGVVDAFEDVAGAAGLREHGKAGAESPYPHDGVSIANWASRSRMSVASMVLTIAFLLVAGGSSQRAESGDVEKTPVDRAGLSAVSVRIVLNWWERDASDGSDLLEPGDVSEGARLHEDVAQRGGLGRPGKTWRDP